jgi:hypothetical protein
MMKVRSDVFKASMALLVVSACVGVQAFESGSSQVDGAFSPIADVAVPLPASGIFNFTSVNIPAGVTVTFTRNAANTPVRILASGDVTIDGTISVNGGDASAPDGDRRAGVGGPGGFDGGVGGLRAGSEATFAGDGAGPGGGTGGSICAESCLGGAGGFDSASVSRTSDLTDTF